MNTIIITGSNGFIGSNLVNTLSKTHKLILLVRVKSKSKKTKYIFNKNISFKFFKNNTELKNLLKKVKGSWLIHCATHYVKKHQSNDIVKIINSNIELGTILLDNLNVMGTKNFINFSTIWENYNGIKNNPHNLYSASKQAFEKIINYYQINNKKINFYSLVISDTYGANDKRQKLISVIKKNIINKKETKIISKNLHINLLNVNDIVSGVFILLKSKIKPGKYSMINKIPFKAIDLIQQIQKRIKSQVKIKWLSSKKIKEKIYNYKSLPGWKPRNTNIDDLIKFILRD
jgi:nucleoside-diphosphate-sugar epimerase